MQTLTKKRLLATTRQYTGPKISNIVETFGMFLITTEIDLDLIPWFFFLSQNKKKVLFCEIDSSNFRNLFLDWTFFKISGPLCLKQKTKKVKFRESRSQHSWPFQTIVFPGTVWRRKEEFEKIFQKLYFYARVRIILCWNFFPLYSTKK